MGGFASLAPGPGMKRPLSEMAATFDASAAALEIFEDTLADRWRKVLTQSVLDRAEVDRSDVVLDLGCGTGLITRVLAPHVKRVVAVDCSPGALAIAREEAAGLKNIHWLRGDLRDPPGVPDLTTVIYCNAMRYLAPAERKLSLRRVWDMLPEDGLIVIGDLIWTMAPEIVDGAEEMGLEDFAYTLHAEPLGEILQGLGAAPRLLALHPAWSVVTALKGP
jgi:SAM-dependent methyltransferase